MLACLLVLGHHAAQYVSLPAPGSFPGAIVQFFSAGSFGVAIFIMLSGYLLSRPWWDGLELDSRTLGRYALSRAARIIPAYHLALLGTVLISAVFFEIPVTETNLWRLLAGMTFISFITPETFFPVPVNAPLWTISMEFFCYAALPAVVSVGRRIGKPLAATIGLLCFTLAVQCVVTIAGTPAPAGRAFSLVDVARQWMPNYNPAAFLAIFLCGVLTAGVERHIPRVLSPQADVVALCSLGAIGAIVGLSAGIAPHGYGLFNVPYAFPLIELAIAGALLSLPRGMWFTLLDGSLVVRLLARWSFGIYLWQMLCFETMRTAFGLPFPPDDQNPLVEGLSIVTSIAAILLVAASSWHFVERPAISSVRMRRSEV